MIMRRYLSFLYLAVVNMMQLVCPSTLSYDWQLGPETPEMVLSTTLSSYLAKSDLRDNTNAKTSIKTVPS